MKIAITLMIFSILLISCSESNNSINEFEKYNLIESGSGIYSIIKKDVSKELLQNKSFEKLIYQDSLLIKIERYDSTGSLSDNFSVPAITEFTYNRDKMISTLTYFDRNRNKAKDELFGFHSIHYVYDNQKRVKAEFYKDIDGKFLHIPKNIDGDIAKINFIPPILTYEYVEDNIIIKAFDSNFNLLKETNGQKPCIPFIDCGEN